MITFFSIPKAFKGHFNVIQRNAIKSWSLLPCDCEIILFGNEVGTEEVAREVGAKYIRECEVTSHGTPRIDDVFLKAQKFARHNLLCYINTDIILISDFIQTTERLKKYSKNFLAVGQRLDLEVKESLSFDNGWEQALIDRANNHGKWYGPLGIDYFLFRKGLWKTIPPFAVGRTVWDNWLIYEARRQSAIVIDATKCIHAIHQNHDYSHSMGGAITVWKGVEAQQNLALAGGYRYCFTIQDSTQRWQKGGGVHPAFITLHLIRRFIVWIILHPKLLAIIDLVWKRKKSKHIKN
jgi:hypothetical protein